MLGELFDPKAEFFIQEGCRPHWSQAGAVVFITFRTHDSIPHEVMQRWDREKQDWLIRRTGQGGRHWREIVPTLTENQQQDFRKTFRRQREDFLDTCHGRCLLKRPDLSKIVADSLLHFDGERYRMGDFVVMPNHVHLLAAFPHEAGMRAQCESWMHYTAVQIHRAICEQGRFWQREPFDHLIRSPEQYEYLSGYIADNPRKANLQTEEYHLRRLP